MRLLLPLLLFAATAAAQQWTRINVPSTASFRGLSVVSDKVVWASGTDGKVIRTIDGGNTWSVMTVAGTDKLDFRGIHAFDARTAVIISSGPAEAMGLGGEIGSLRPGRRGDVVIWDGDPLELASAPVAVYIDGVQQPLENRQTRLRDRYRSLDESKLPRAFER